MVSSSFGFFEFFKFALHIFIINLKKVCVFLEFCFLINVHHQFCTAQAAHCLLFQSSSSAVLPSTLARCWLWLCNGFLVAKTNTRISDMSCRRIFENKCQVGSLLSCAIWPDMGEHINTELSLRTSNITI